MLGNLCWCRQQTPAHRGWGGLSTSIIKHSSTIRLPAIIRLLAIKHSSTIRLPAIIRLLAIKHSSTIRLPAIIRLFALGETQGSRHIA